jgi:hypothetical protein
MVFKDKYWDWDWDPVSDPETETDPPGPIIEDWD